MWLIFMTILLVAVGVVLMLWGKQALDDPRAKLSNQIGGALCLLAGAGILIQTIISLLEI